MELTPSEKDLLIRMLNGRIIRYQRIIRRMNHEGGEILRAIPYYEDDIKTCCRLIEKLGGAV